MKRQREQAAPVGKSQGRLALLFYDIDTDAGFEPDREVVAKDGNFVDELFDQSLIELCDVGLLSGDEVLQLLDSIHGFFPVMAVDLGLFLLVAEPENLICDGIVVLLVVCLLDEFLLQLLKPCLNAIRGEGVSIYHGLCDVLL